MMLPRVRSSVVFLSVIALITGIALLVYARWSTPLLHAAAAVREGDSTRALAAYQVSTGRFGDMPITQQLFPRDFSRAAHNQLALLYKAGMDVAESYLAHGEAEVSTARRHDARALEPGAVEGEQPREGPARL